MGGVGGTKLNLVHMPHIPVKVAGCSTIARSSCAPASSIRRCSSCAVAPSPLYNQKWALE